MQTLSPSLRIGVLRGGPSPEYDISLQSGGNVLRQLSETHRPLDIFISKNGVWHMHGLPRKPEKIFPHIDIFWNALHGVFGEDGKLQKILDSHGVKYTGSGAFASALCMNKKISKEIFAKNGLKTPRHVVIKRNDDISEKSKEIFKTFLMPVVVKPVSAGSSIGVSIVDTVPEIIDAVRSAFKHGAGVLVEEYVKGKEATCAVLENFRGKPIYAFLPIEIRPSAKFFDYDSKYVADASEEICPGHFFEEEKKTIENYARLAHSALGLSQYSRSDFIVAPKRGVFILETNSLPGLTEQSLLPKSLSAVGLSQKDFIHHVLSLALNKK
jgi:D-alanine--D-alanine ligase